MRKSEPTRHAAIKAVNMKWVSRLYEAQAMADHELGVLWLIADMLDEIAAGKDYYMIIGATKARDAVTLTIKGDDGPGAIYALDLADLSCKAHELL